MTAGEASSKAWTREHLGKKMTTLTEEVRMAEKGRPTFPDWPFFGDQVPQKGAVLSIVGKANFRWPPPGKPLPVGREPRVTSCHSLHDFPPDVMTTKEILDASLDWGHTFRKERILDMATASDGYTSPWWRFVLQLLYSLEGRTGPSYERGDRPLADLLGWDKIKLDLSRRPPIERANLVARLHATNLYKVAEVEANPGKDLMPILSKTSPRQLLEEEMELARPVFVVMPIGTWPSVKHADFPSRNDWWRWKYPTARCRHPQGATTKQLEAIYQEIIATVTAAR